MRSWASEFAQPSRKRLDAETPVRGLISSIKRDVTIDRKTRGFCLEIQPTVSCSSMRSRV
jgi:hypothetical protein